MRTLTTAAALAAALAMAPGQATGRQTTDAQFQEELRAPRPIEAVNSVWIEDLTWMEVRDLLAAGHTTAIIATGGIEQNGPYLVTGKHNVVLQGACEGIARALGNALCAPVVKLVPEGDIDVPSGHMRYPGTLSLRQETFEAVLHDVASSLRAHGFTDVVFIGDSGGNQSGMENVAAALNARWKDARAYFIPEFYTYADVLAYMENDLGARQTTNDGLHDDFAITSMMMAVDPATVRYDQRVAAGRTTINGASITPKERAVEVGRKLFAFRVQRTVDAIRASMGGA
jgi:creatinine amidohydrolase/Fe(II)-dependent formamide hydrolase-like protein